MIDSIYECEVKILGNRQVLTTVFNNFTKNSISTLRDRVYTFDTHYLDTVDGSMERQGYSLRYRPTRFQFNACMEAKQLEGSEDGVSKRIEIGVRSDIEPSELYKQLQSSIDLKWPEYKDLSTIFKTSVCRHETTAMMRIAGKHIVLEASLDEIQYLYNNKIIGYENELEVELKSGFTTPLADIFNFAKNKLTSGIDVYYTTKSKAVRAREFLTGVNGSIHCRNTGEDGDSLSPTSTKLHGEFICL